MTRGVKGHILLSLYESVWKITLSKKLILIGCNSYRGQDVAVPVFGPRVLCGAQLVQNVDGGV